MRVGLVPNGLLDETWTSTPHAALTGGGDHVGRAAGVDLDEVVGSAGMDDPGGVEDIGDAVVQPARTAGLTSSIRRMSPVTTSTWGRVRERRRVLVGVHERPHDAGSMPRARLVGQPGDERSRPATRWRRSPR